MCVRMCEQVRKNKNKMQHKDKKVGTALFDKTKKKMQHKDKKTGTLKKEGLCNMIRDMQKVFFVF